MDTPLCVGIDIGKRNHVAVVLSATLLKKHKRLDACPTIRFENSRAGFTQLWTWLRTHGNGTEYHVLIERTGHYSAPLMQFLGETAVCMLYLAHPQKRRPADKDDRRDARTLAQSLYGQIALGLPVTESQLLARPYVQPSETARLAHGLVQHRDELVQMAVRHKNRLTAICDELFPELTQVYADPNSPSALALREAFPTPAAVAEASIEQLCATRKTKRPGTTTLSQLQELARTTIGCKDTQRIAALVLEQGQVIAMHRLMLVQVDHLELQLSEAIAGSREGQILRSMGLGVVQSATLLAGIGSIGNFERAAHLRGYMGWRPRSEQTGTTLDVVGLTRGGTRPLKRTMYLVALSAVQREPWKTLYNRLVPLKARYDARLKRYRGKMKVIGRIVGQFIGVMYTLLKKDYDLLASVPVGVEPPEPTLYDAEKHGAAMASAAGRRAVQRTSEVEGRAEQERHDTPPILPPSAQAE